MVKFIPLFALYWVIDIYDIFTNFTNNNTHVRISFEDLSNGCHMDIWRTLKGSMETERLSFSANGS